MEKTDQAKIFNKRNIFLTGGIITLLISLLIIYPVEYGKSYLIDDFVYTFLTLAIALFLLMFGLMGKSFFKGILFLLGSTIFGFIVFYFAYLRIPWSGLAAVYLGIPSGIVTAIVFFLGNYLFLRNKTNYKLLKQVTMYLLILLVVSILFAFGGDWSFEISQYLQREN